jgi:hypothetical protein
VNDATGLLWNEHNVSAPDPAGNRRCLVRRCWNREVKQRSAASKHEERTIVDEQAQADAQRRRLLLGTPSVRLHRVDLIGADLHERDQGGNRECRRDVETKTMGMIAVAALPANAEAVPTGEAITATCRRTKSAASAGN